MSASGSQQILEKTEPPRGVKHVRPPIKPKPVLPPRPKEIFGSGAENKNPLLSPTCGPCSPTSDIPSAIKISQLTGPQPYGTRRTSLRRWSSSVGEDANQENNALSPVENRSCDLPAKVTAQPLSAPLRPLQTGPAWKGKSPFMLTTRGWGEQRLSRDHSDSEAASQNPSSSSLSKDTDAQKGEKKASDVKSYSKITQEEKSETHDSDLSPARLASQVSDGVKMVSSGKGNSDGSTEIKDSQKQTPARLQSDLDFESSGRVLQDNHQVPAIASKPSVPVRESVRVPKSQTEGERVTNVHGDVGVASGHLWLSNDNVKDNLATGDKSHQPELHAVPQQSADVTPKSYTQHTNTTYEQHHDKQQPKERKLPPKPVPPKPKERKKPSVQFTVPQADEPTGGHRPPDSTDPEERETKDYTEYMGRGQKDEPVAEEAAPHAQPKTDEEDKQGRCTGTPEASAHVRTQIPYNTVTVDEGKFSKEDNISKVPTDYTTSHRSEHHNPDVGRPDVHGSSLHHGKVKFTDEKEEGFEVPTIARATKLYENHENGNQDTKEPKDMDEDHSSFQKTEPGEDSTVKNVDYIPHFSPTASASSPAPRAEYGTETSSSLGSRTSYIHHYTSKEDQSEVLENKDNKEPPDMSKESQSEDNLPSQEIDTHSREFHPASAQEELEDNQTKSSKLGGLQDFESSNPNKFPLINFEDPSGGVIQSRSDSKDVIEYYNINPQNVQEGEKVKHGGAVSEEHHYPWSHLDELLHEHPQSDKLALTNAPFERPNDTNLPSKLIVHAYASSDEPSHAYASSKEQGHAYTPSEEPSHAYTSSEEPAHAYESSKEPAHAYASSEEPTHAYASSEEPSHAYASSEEPTHAYASSEEPSHAYASSEEQDHAYASSEEPTHAYTSSEPGHAHRPSKELVHTHAQSEEPVQDYSQSEEDSHKYTVLKKARHACDKPEHLAYAYTYPEEPGYQYECHQPEKLDETYEQSEEPIPEHVQSIPQKHSEEPEHPNIQSQEDSHNYPVLKKAGYAYDKPFKLAYTYRYPEEPGHPHIQPEEPSHLCDQPEKLEETYEQSEEPISQNVHSMQYKHSEEPEHLNIQSQYDSHSYAVLKKAGYAYDKPFKLAYTYRHPEEPGHPHIQPEKSGHQHEHDQPKKLDETYGQPEESMFYNVRSEDISHIQEQSKTPTLTYLQSEKSLYAYDQLKDTSPLTDHMEEQHPEAEKHAEKTKHARPPEKIIPQVTSESHYQQTHAVEPGARDYLSQTIMASKIPAEKPDYQQAQSKEPKHYQEDSEESHYHQEQQKHLKGPNYQQKHFIESHYQQEHSEGPEYLQQDSKGPYYQQQDLEGPKYLQKDSEDPNYQQQDSEGPYYQQQDLEGLKYQQQDSEGPYYQQQDLEGPKYQEQDSEDPNYQQQDLKGPKYQQQDSESPNYQQDSEQPNYHYKHSEESHYRQAQSEKNELKFSQAENLKYKETSSEDSRAISHYSEQEDLQTPGRQATTFGESNHRLSESTEYMDLTAAETDHGHVTPNETESRSEKYLEQQQRDSSPDENSLPSKEQVLQYTCQEEPKTIETQTTERQQRDVLPQQRDHRDVLPGQQEHRDVLPGQQEHKDVLPGQQEHRDVLPGQQEHKDVLPGQQEHRDVLPGEREHRDVLPGQQEHRDVLPGQQGHRDVLPGQREHRDVLQGQQGHIDVLPGQQEHIDVLPGQREHRDVLPGQREHRDVLPGQREHRDVLPGQREHRDVLPGQREHIVTDGHQPSSELQQDTHINGFSELEASEYSEERTGGPELSEEIKEESPEETESETEETPEEDNFDFLEGTTVLDTSLMRCRASVGRKRCHRTPAAGASPEEADPEYWMFRDSTEPRPSPANESDNDERGETSPECATETSPSSAKSPTKKGGLFSGIISPSLLKGRLKARSKTSEDEAAKTEPKESQDPTSPGKDKSESSSHSLNWLQALKKKKKKHPK